MDYVLPFYHTVSNEPLPHICHLYQVKSEIRFKADLDRFCEQYDPVDLITFTELAKCNFKKLKKPVFHLTFDDGLRECETIIAPILVQKGIPATFFINSAFIDNQELFFRFKVSLIIDHLKNDILTSGIRKKFETVFHTSSVHQLAQFLKRLKHGDGQLIHFAAEILEIDFADYLSNNQPYLMTKQIDVLQKKGFAIGAHSVDHPEFRFIPFAEQINQIEKSIESLANRFEMAVRAFSFPFSDYQVSKQLFDMISNNKLVDITFGTSGMKKDQVPFNYQRMAMENGLTASQSLLLNHFKKNLRTVLGRNTICRK